MSGFSATAPGGPPPLSELRIVLLGETGAGKDRVARAIMRDTKLNEWFLLYKGEQVEREICIIDTPGWGKDSIEFTTKKTKNEIVRSVTLCPPGPHALILVLPVKTGDVPSLNELKSASEHIELLSERVWNHTMVLFLCDGVVEESIIKEHMQKAEELLEKCRGRHYVMQQCESETQVHGLLQEIDSMVEENLGDFFLPQVYYDVFQSKMRKDISKLEKQYKDREEMLKQGYQKRLSMYKKQAEDETVLKQKHASIGTRPSFSEDKNQPVDINVIKEKYRDELHGLASYYFKLISLIVFAVIALIGSVVGSSYGVVGSGVGIVIGIVVSIPLVLWMIGAARLVRQSSTFVEKIKFEHGLNSTTERYKILHLYT